MKTTKIVNEGKDEIYCDWYRCFECGCKSIMAYANFCPNCGLKIIKKEDEKKSN